MKVGAWARKAKPQLGKTFPLSPVLMFFPDCLRNNQYENPFAVRQPMLSIALGGIYFIL